jgi:hypothetical protein
MVAHDITKQRRRGKPIGDTKASASNSASFLEI